VEATRVGIQQHFIAMANNPGLYLFSQLPLGKYTLKGSAMGFKQAA